MGFIGVHWSPLELENLYEQKNNVSKRFLPLEPIGVHWSWRFKMRSRFSRDCAVGVGD